MTEHNPFRLRLDEPLITAVAEGRMQWITHPDPRRYEPGRLMLESTNQPVGGWLNPLLADAVIAAGYATERHRPPWPEGRVRVNYQSENLNFGVKYPGFVRTSLPWLIVEEGNLTAGAMEGIPVVEVHDDGTTLTGYELADRVDLSDQRPWNDWTPGWWAWKLDLFDSVTGEPV